MPNNLILYALAGALLLFVLLLVLATFGIDRANKNIHKDHELDGPTIYTEEN